MRKKTVISLCAWAIIGLTALSAFGAPAPDQKKGSKKAAYVRVKTMTPAAVIREGFWQNTSLEALQRVVLYPRVTGRLEELKISKGMELKKGDLIAVLGHSEQSAQIASAQATVARHTAETENARIELQRYQRLKKEGFSTQQLLDSKETAYRSARAQLEAAQSELKRLTATRDEYIIKASIDGTVLNDYSRVPGAMLSASTAVAELADLKTLKATFYVPEKRFYSIRPGMSVLLKMDALPKEEFVAKIVRIDDYIDPDSRTAGVEARIDNSTTGNRLRPGMFGKAFVVEKEAAHAFVVPLAALRLPRSEGVTENEVLLYVQGKAKVVKVRTGITQGLDVQIIEGVQEGDQVVFFGGNNVSDGESLKLM